MSQEYQATRVALSFPSVVTVDESTTAPLAPSAFTSCCRVARSRTLSSSPSRSPRAHLRPPLAVAACVAPSRHAATPAMAVARTSTPSRRPSSPRPPPTPKSVCSRPNEAPGPGHHLHTSPERHRRSSIRRRPAARRGATTTDHPEPPNHHPQVRTSPLNLFPNFPLAAGAEPRWKWRRPTLLCSASPPGTSSEKKHTSRGLNAKVRFLFLLFSKTANL